MTPLLFAHRGASVEAPENTLPAFRRAAEAGADGIELDVQLSREGVPVVIHDETLDRTTDGAGAVKDRPLAELEALDAGAWFGGAFAGTRLPTLEAVLDWARGTGLWLNLELKTGIEPYPGIEAATVELVRRLGLTARTILSSFNHETLREAARLAPEIPRAALLSDRLLAPWDYAQAHGFSALHPERHACTAETVSEAHRAGLAVRTWSVDDPAEFRRLAALGVDAVFTNDPRRLVEERARIG